MLDWPVRRFRRLRLARLGATAERAVLALLGAPRASSGTRGVAS